MGETVVSKFGEQVVRLKNQPSILYKQQHLWKKLSWSEVDAEIIALARGLMALGIEKGKKVALLSQTRFEWTLLDMAILSIGGVTVPIYPTLSDQQIGIVLDDAEVSLLIIENIKLKNHIVETLSKWKERVFLIEGSSAGLDNLDSLKEKGKAVPVAAVKEAAFRLEPADLASLIYTSGTTGEPKGVMVTHQNFLAEVKSLQEVFKFRPDQIGMMALPLAHVLARAFQFYLLAQGCQTAFAESIELLPPNLREVRPHLMLGVPRLFEKSFEKIMNRVESGPGWMQKLFHWSVAVGKEKSLLSQRRLPISLVLRFKIAVARILVFQKITAGFGGRMEVMISGGAPLSKEIAHFFHALGMLIIEGYGLTETFAAATVNRTDDFRFGTVGKPLSCCRVKIREDGEIAIKGENVFVGYFNKPVATKEAFDGEGWFLTGDIGEFSKDGFLKITDRKKDIIVTAAGKNIPPQAVERLLLASPYISQAMVYGDRQRFLTALLTLNWASIEAFAKEKKIAYHSRAELAGHAAVQNLVEQEMAACNAKLSQYETIKKYAILETEFSVETGELTPTLKVKRKEVAKKFHHILERLYQ